MSASAIEVSLQAEAKRKPLPAGARLVIPFEFFERHAFYSTFSLLVLFLSATATCAMLLLRGTINRAVACIGVVL